MEVIKSTNRAILLQITEKEIEKDTLIISDSWKSCNNVDKTNIGYNFWKKRVAKKQNEEKDKKNLLESFYDVFCFDFL